MFILWAFQVALVVKSPLVNAGGIRDMGSVPGQERSPEGACSNPLQYFCLENPMDRGAQWAMVHSITNKVTNGQTRLKQLSMHTHVFILYQFYISDRNNKKSKQQQSKLFKRNSHQATLLTQSKYYFNFFQINVNSLDMELLAEELGFHLLHGS